MLRMINRLNHFEFRAKVGTRFRELAKGHDDCYNEKLDY